MEYGLVIIAIILCNTHMAVFPMYFVLFLPYIVEEILSKFFINDRKKYLLGKIEIERHDKLKSLLIIFGISALVGVINPSGFTPYTYTIKTMMGNTMQYIREHKPLDLQFLLYNKQYIYAFIITIIIIIYPKIKIKICDLFLLIGLISLCFISVRQFSLFILISSSIFAIYLTKVINHFFKLKIFKGENFVLLKIVSAILIIFIILMMSIKYFNKQRKVEYVIESKYPINASLWIKDNLILEKLRMYNSYEDGSYLIFQGIPDFVDSRCDLFTYQFNKNLEKENDIFTDSMSINNNEQNYKKIFKKYNINACLINKSYSTIEMLKNDSNFKNVYEDDYYIIYIRKDFEGYRLK